MRDPVAERFAANLKQTRRRAGLSQEDLAFMASLHRTEISLLETGARTPKISTLVKICAGLEVEPNELLEGIRWQIGHVSTGKFKLPEERTSS